MPCADNHVVFEILQFKTTKLLMKKDLNTFDLFKTQIKTNQHFWQTEV